MSLLKYLAKYNSLAKCGDQIKSSNTTNQDEVLIGAVFADKGNISAEKFMFRNKPE